MSARFEITDAQVDAAIDYTVDNGAREHGHTVTYSEVFSAAGLPPPQELHHGGDSHVITALMERFHYRCRRRQLPPLDALVVHAAGIREGKPGAGYFRVNQHKDPFGDRASAEDVVAAFRFWEREVERCRAWGERGAERPLPAAGQALREKVKPMVAAPPTTAGRHIGTDSGWTLSDLHEELRRFEIDARRAGLAENSVRTYVDRSRIFVRWLAGDFHFRGPNG